tara:strand:+ start:354 stop:593 length:240 start_codon:yes stop_codon:yes gene_type:complete
MQESPDQNTFVTHWGGRRACSTTIEHLFVQEGKPRGNTRFKLKKIEKRAIKPAFTTAPPLFFDSYFNLRWWKALTFMNS